MGKYVLAVSGGDNKKIKKETFNYSFQMSVFEKTAKV